MKVERFDTREALDAALASRLGHAIAAAGGAIMLSGGHAPRPAYATIGAQVIPPGKDLRLIYSDERHVPATSQDSNYRASLPLLGALRLPDANVLRVRTELSLEEAAADYESRLAELLDAGTAIRFGLLGMGRDGHTASLFQPGDLDRARGRLAVAVQRPDGMQAVTVTPGLLSRVEHLLMVVAGREKCDALAAFLARDASSIAWRAVSACPDLELWCERQDV